MKALRLLLLALFVVGALFYLNALIPQQSTNAAVYPGSIVSTDDGMMTIHPRESVGTNGSSYAVDFQLISNTGHTLHTTVVTHNFFCPNLSPDGKCYENPTQRTQTIDVPADHYVDVWSDVATPAMAHVSGFSNCGLYQIDLNLSYPGAHNHATYQAAGGMNTGKVCKTVIPTPPAQHHNVCQNNACVSVDGAGTSTCTTVANPSSECSHLTCQNNTCTRVAGAGSNACDTEGTSCQTTQHHNICQNFACVQVDGAGTSTCNTPADNSSECSHLACQSNACTRVTGGGSDSCSKDDNCKTQTHKACVSNACMLVVGSGSDSCSQDSDCHTDTCTGTNCGQININVQQQQQQAVLAASVAPAVTSTSLPSTGSGTDVLFTLLGLLPVGFKLRKLV